jgi:hypothetical protein
MYNLNCRYPVYLGLKNIVFCCGFVSLLDSDPQPSKKELNSILLASDPDSLTDPYRIALDPAVLT